MICLVTGAGGGMGSALCRCLVQEGWRVIGLDLNPPAQHEGWEYMPADLTRPEDLKAVFRKLASEGTELDAIVHMAGVYDLNSLIEMPEEDFIRDFDINLFGMFRVNRTFVPLLKEGGRILMVSSELAPLNPLPFTGIYGITKTAVERYAAALRMELQLLGHPVIVIRPGAVRTGMLPASTEKLERFCAATEHYACNAERFRKIVKSVEARNVPPEAIAGICLKALTARRPRLLYCINRNPLLLILNLFPERFQLWIIRMILK